MLRRVIAVALSLVVAVALFWAMQALISISGDRKVTKDIGPIDFVRIKRDESLDVRSRKKPPKPPPPKKPPPPPDLAVKRKTPTRSPTPVNMPKLNIPTHVTGGPFLGGFSPGAGGNELIPVVQVAPRMPRRALRDGITGYVKVRITVNPDGTVKDVSIEEANPRGVFERAAIAAIYKWKFKPKVVDGQPVQQDGIQNIDFGLDE